MTTLRNKEKIKAFVKKTLGCSCPDKVFGKIDISELSITKYENDIIRVVVGDTLLIYLVRLEYTADFVDHVAAIGLAGREDRDRHHYNRFRLVVSGLESDSQQASVSTYFESLFDTDAKMHIHCVTQQLVDDLS